MPRVPSAGRQGVLAVDKIDLPLDRRRRLMPAAAGPAL
jgi:hypothetical protein